MEVSYKRDVNHTFLVIRLDGEIDTKAYPVRMVLGNVIPGLLPCRMQKADGDILLYYDITNRQCLADAYGKLTYVELKEIYQRFLKIFEQMEVYLLNLDQLLLEAEYVYVDKKEGDMSLCYLPGYEKPVQEQLRCFTEYLLPRMEHQDSQGVMLGYGIYRLMVEDGFQMENVRAHLHQSEKQRNGPETPTGESIPGQEAEDDWAAMEYEEEKKGGERKEDSQKNMWVKDLIMIFTGLFLFGGFAGLKSLGYFSWLTVPIMLAVLFCLVLGMGVIFLSGRKKDMVNEHVDKETAENTIDERRERVEFPDFLHKEVNEDAAGEETVVLYRNPEYEYPVLVCEEPGQAPPIVLNREMLIIGKVDGVSDVLLNRVSVSRVHAKICKKDNEYWISDLNSKNGTFINGKKLEKEEEYPLQSEDQVVFADVCYRFVKKR